MDAQLLSLLAPVSVRAIVSAFFKIPVHSALLYNLVDIAVTVNATYMVYLVRQDFKSKEKESKGRIVEFELTTTLIALAVSRIAGITAGMLATQVINRPIQLRDAFVISFSSLIGFLAIGSTAGSLKYHKLV